MVITATNLSLQTPCKHIWQTEDERWRKAMKTSWRPFGHKNILFVLYAFWSFFFWLLFLQPFKIAIFVISLHMSQKMLLVLRPWPLRLCQIMWPSHLCLGNLGAFVAFLPVPQWDDVFIGLIHCHQELSPILDTENNVKHGNTYTIHQSSKLGVLRPFQ